MGADEAIDKALGRIAEILVQGQAKVDLNGVLEVLEELRLRSYRQGYDDGLNGSDEERNAAAEREYDLHFRELGVGE